ncbi:mitogen-activated protein kinase kinase kinase [Salvia divinorum]|uniref:Mitogen-activated protein kinase kinase kinase n=1 Tax=Salvia divinorum TaxID=28513 RepID=A0ABD1HWT2_SALDI
MGLNGNPPAIIKKIAGLVSDVYKQKNLDLSSKKAAREEALDLSENGGVQLLGQIKHGSCRPRAILFKVLADAVGVKSRLLVAIYMSHISAAGESDSADYDSCDSPMEPNSPLYGNSERVEAQSAENEDGLIQYRQEASLNAASPSLRNMMLLRTKSTDGKFSLSQSEPNITDSFWKSQREAITSHRTANPRVLW